MRRRPPAVEYRRPPERELRRWRGEPSLGGRRQRATPRRVGARRQSHRRSRPEPLRRRQPRLRVVAPRGLLRDRRPIRNQKSESANDQRVVIGAGRGPTEHGALRSGGYGRSARAAAQASVNRCRLPGNL
jgi:hypothetical protein